MDDCPFCRIVAGERDAYVLYDDEATVAFLDENPAREAHALVVPTAHVEDLLLAPGGTAVFRTARAVAAAMDDALDPDGFSVFHTTGGLVGSVEHAHLHVLSRRREDDLSLALERESLADHDPERLVERVREVL